MRDRETGEMRDIGRQTDSGDRKIGRKKEIEIYWDRER